MVLPENKQNNLYYFKQLIQEASHELLEKVWTEDWVDKLGINNKKAYKVINEAQVQLEREGQLVYLPSRIRRGIAERVGRILQGQYKRMNCYFDCLKTIEQIGIDAHEAKLVKIVQQTFRTKNNYPTYKKIMAQQTIRMLKNWYEKLAIDFEMFKYTDFVNQEVKRFAFPYGPDDGQAIQYVCGEQSICHRMKLPVIPQPKSKQDWQWVESEVVIPAKIQKKIQQALSEQPKKPMLLIKTLKGGLRHFFLQFPWEFPKQPKKEEQTERALAVDLGLKKIATAVVCETGEQLSKPIYIKLKGRQYRHIEEIYLHIASIQTQLSKLKDRKRLENTMITKKEERRRLYSKRNRLGDELVNISVNQLIQLALDWKCSKIIIEDLRNYKPPHGRRSWSRRLSEWLRGRIAHTLEYKCQEKGLCLQKVCPLNTSSHCPRCTKEGLKVKGPNDLAADPKGTRCGNWVWITFSITVEIFVQKKETVNKMVMDNWITLNLTTKGSFNLKRTLETGHSSFPIPRSDKSGRYYFVITIPDSHKKVVCRVYQKGAKLIAEVSSYNEQLSENDLKALKKLLRKTFGLHLNVLEFYSEFKNDPIAPAFKHCSGVRLTCAHDHFESLISSILTQNSSIWKWVGQARRIKELMGDKFPTDHFMVYSFPDPQKLFRYKHLLIEAKLGYREEYVIESTQDIANYQIRLDKLKNIPTMEAKKVLLKLKGIGPKVADMFLLYGLGKIDVPPTDIWIQRGVSKIFFKGREKSLEECREKLVERYGKWAGIAQLYMFDWIRSTAKK